jgi:hypothetical protein
MALVGFLIAMAGFCRPVQGAVDCTPFYKALEAGDDAGVLATGQNLYTRLAVQADGQEPFYSCGVVLVTAQQATDHIMNLLASPGQPSPWSPLESLWRILPSPLKQQEGAAAQEEPERFLRAYLRLCVNNHMQRILAAGPASASMPAGTAQATADHLVLLMGMLDAGAVAADTGPTRAIAWIISAGQGVRATGQALGHARPALACAVGKAALAAKPADPEIRRQLVDLVAALCKAQYVAEALSLCAAAKDITQDASYSSILLLQQAVITSRDQKNHALAVRLCDEVAAAADDANTILVAKYLAGTFLLEQQEYPQLVTRMEAMVKDPATPLPYRLKASTLRATAWIRQDKPQEAARALSQVLAGLTEPELAEAADCRQVLCQAMLAMQRYDEATRECRVLIARHPGHAGAGVAAQLLEQMGRKPDALPAESRK